MLLRRFFYTFLGYSNAGTNVFIPRTVPDFAYIECIKVSAGGYHTLVLTSDQRVYSFGQADGILGIGDDIPHDSNQTPTAISSLNDVVMIAAGYDHNLCMRSDGQVLVWGHAGKYGRLGLSNSENSHTTKQIPRFDESTPESLYYSPTHTSIEKVVLKSPYNVASSKTRDIRSLACCSNHSCFLKSDGSLYTWGCNGAGRLGHNDLKMRSNPTRIVYFSTVNEGLDGVQSLQHQNNVSYNLEEKERGAGEEATKSNGNKNHTSTIQSSVSTIPHLVDLDHIIMLAKVGYRSVTLRQVVYLLREEPVEWLGKSQSRRTTEMLKLQTKMKSDCVRWKKMKLKLKTIENNIELCITSTVRNLNNNKKRIISGHVDRSIKRYTNEFSMLLSTLVMEPGYILELYNEMVTCNKFEEMLMIEGDEVMRTYKNNIKQSNETTCGKLHPFCQYLEGEGIMDMEVIRPHSMSRNAAEMTGTEHR